MRRAVIWLLAGIIMIALTVVAFCPASWMSVLLERQTGGRLTLGDAQGTLWRGSAFVGGAPGGTEAVTPLLPGRFVWRLSPMAMLGQVDLELENPLALVQPLRISGSWNEWQVSPSSLSLPAERLAGLGAPLNTIQLTGAMLLRWDALHIARQNGQLALDGKIALEMRDIASRLSSIKPLGAYDFTMDWRGQQAQVGLKSLQGPLLLSGAGTVTNGRLQFSGRAEAAAGQEERLANLLSLLGQRRREGNKTIIALEFK